MRFKTGLKSITRLFLFSVPAIVISFATITSLAPKTEYHFHAERGWINDPNGLIEKDGIFHLYYQFYNGSWELNDGRFRDPLQWGPMHWGHATSTDLVQWKHMPVALFPDERIGNSEVKGMIFSGSVVFDAQNTSGFGTKDKPPLVAMYTLADTFGVGSSQRQAIAYSADDGVTWTKYSQNPVLPYNGAETFRDPQVFWFGGESGWAMVISCGEYVCFYNSQNLRNWSYVGKFGEQESGIEAPWECPDLFPLSVLRDGVLETKWILLVSAQHGAPSGSFGVRYFVGDFDGKSFQNSALSSDKKWLDHGSDFYAAKTWIRSKENLDNRILIAWMNNWTYVKDVPSTTYRGSMTIPRILTLQYSGDDYYVKQEIPAGVLQSVPQKNTTLQLDDLHPTKAEEINIPSIVSIDIFPGKKERLFQASLLIDRGKRQSIIVKYNNSTSSISVESPNFASTAYAKRNSDQVATVFPPPHTQWPYTG